MTFEKARDVCMKKLVNAGDFACIQLVYGHSGMYSQYLYACTVVVLQL